ncbi:MAG: SsrA-binding protein SmpB [Anaerolineales bacterium]|jgi:SsrA-binding protein|nr:SsrA-binding protein [Anaerolineaceae bacterium]MDP6225213.1 SsrA-binding protein SmpB [Anaerolineales bacterium]MDP7544405.1 SsrA-binding protein SmpB [Anaerolineales bacterium]HJN42284.1 SsrA-binding protein SmpB [Anaerolineales bacterium]|tara:strand:+ start:1109 stop:1564 length:456 start_codon:yes stop_codon:yes gene_type:complete
MESIKILAQNRKARRDYFLLETFEAGLALQGSEIKSARAGRVQLREAYVGRKGDELWLQNAHIAPYPMAAARNHDPLRPRKLLLHRREIERLLRKTSESGLTIIPTKMYLKSGRAKVEIAVARGRRRHDKREIIARRESERAMRRQLGRRR